MGCVSCEYFVESSRECSRLGRPISRCAGGCKFNRKNTEAVERKETCMDGDKIVDPFAPEKVENKMMNSPLKFFGGKSYMVDYVISQFPKDYHVYVEGFGGGASVLLKKRKTDLEIYNDLGKNVYSLFKVLSDKDMFTRLKEKMDLTYFSYQIWDEARRSLDDTSLSVEDRAYAFLVTNRQRYNGVGGFSVALQVRRGMSKSVSDYLSMIDRLPELHDRLSSVIIENRDIFKILEKYDAEDTFFYLDPPYVKSTRSSSTTYECEMSDDDHRKLVEVCLNLKGKVLISGYDHPIYDALLPKFKKVCFQSQNSNSDRTETLWRNYDVSGDEQSPTICKQDSDEYPAADECEEEDRCSLMESGIDSCMEAMIGETSPDEAQDDEERLESSCDLNDGLDDFDERFCENTSGSVPMEDVEDCDTQTCECDDVHEVSDDFDDNEQTGADDEVQQPPEHDDGGSETTIADCWSEQLKIDEILKSIK